MDREKVIYKWYIISALIISLITATVIICSLFDLDSYYLIISIWGHIASFWLYFNVVLLTLILLKKTENFNPLLPILYIFGEIFSSIVDSLLSFVAIKNGTNPILMTSGSLAVILNLIFPIIAIVVAIKLILKTK